MTPSISRNNLPRGYQLLWYQIDGVLGRGTFGVTYLATDTNLDRQVAVKEYFPLELSLRNRDLSIQAIDAESQETHLACLQRFLTEARTLAKLNHPNIVRVYNVFESNETAYMAMEYEQGESLDTLIRKHALREESRILKILHPMLDALEYIHERGYIHRDIKPGNIYIRRDDSPVLLDFGSTRVTPKQDSDTLTQLVSQGYAPHEQYGGGAGRQGQWTDIYAFGATFYALVCNRSPVNALERASAHASGHKDPLTPASTLCANKYSARLLGAIDKAMQVIPSDRPESVSALRKLFPSPRSTFTANPESRKNSGNRLSGHGSPAPKLEKNETFITLRSEIRDYSNHGKRQRRKHANTFGLNKGTWGFLLILVVFFLAWTTIKTFVAGANEKQRQPVPEKFKTTTNKPQIAPIKKDREPSKINTKKKPPANIETAFHDTLPNGLKGPELVLISEKLLRSNTSKIRGHSSITTPSKAFFLGRYEVTFAEYEQFVNATHHQLPNDSGWGRDNRPVMNVSWNDAIAYTQWLSEQTGQNYRLPSAEEWRFAASSGTETAYWWGNNIARGHANCNGCGSQWDNTRTAPVGSFKPNFFGLYDTAGNVWEWVQDCSNPTRTYSEKTNARIEQCTERVFLGGAWNSKASALVISKQNGDGPELRYRYVGFRVARDI